MNRLSQHASLRRYCAGVLLLSFCAALSSAGAAVESDLPPELARLQNAGRYRELVRGLQAALETQPNSAALHYWMGRTFYELRDYNKAISSLQRATELAPDRSEYFNWYGKATGRRAQEVNPFSALSLARRTHRAFQTAVRLQPTNIEAHRDLIRYLMNAPGFLGGGDDETLKQIQALSVVDAVDGMLARAEYLATRKKFDQAVAEYEKILRTGVRRIGVQLEIAEYYRDRGDATRMQAAVDAAARLGPSDPRLDYYRGIALILPKRDLGAAEQHLRTYLQSVPDSSQVPSHSSAHEWLGKLYEAEGKPDQAAAEYQVAVQLNPRNEEARKALEQVRKR
jgi:tetratricopeptide (TPR) repeat protein